MGLRVDNGGLAEVLARERARSKERVFSRLERDRGGYVSSGRVAADEEPFLQVDLQVCRVLSHLAGDIRAARLHPWTAWTVHAPI